MKIYGEGKPGSLPNLASSRSATPERLESRGSLDPAFGDLGRVEMLSARCGEVGCTFAQEMKRIVITGPESSGKSTLARYLATAFDTVYVPEYARVYLEEKGRDYRESDLVNIAVGQLALLESIEAAATGKRMIFLDTWMLTIRIWSLYRFGSVPDLIEHMYHAHQPELYLLCTPDLAWEPDPLRENPDDRDMLFELYERHIITSAIPYITVNGTDAAREQRAVQSLQKFIVNLG